MKIGIGIGNTF